jgi:phosphatidylserine/phosphatidylglycerophosphate/cardiolipin synthase-like enzyme
MLLVLVSCGKHNDDSSTPAPPKTGIETQTTAPETLIITPDDLQTPIIDAISKAKEKIDLSNFHLSNFAVVNALIAASKRDVKIRMILDNGTLSKSAPAQKIVAELQANNIEVKPSSKFFSITHEKSFVIDNHLALVSSINLVTTAATTRDFGLFTEDKDVVTEMLAVFEADWENADTNKGVTPALSNARLLWSPINSSSKLVDLIMSAKHDIKLMVENLGSNEIRDALLAKAKEGIAIQTLTPGCIMGDALRNRPFLKLFADNNIQNKVSAQKADSEHPYIHAKMILVDGKNFYLGSENFSYNSLLKAREVGIITTDETKGQKISATFDHDWNNGLAPEAVDCKKAPPPPSTKPTPPTDENGDDLIAIAQ